uniref:Uncharacterized protein n=1 Tax=Arundo donax TaxID=35708 RepID=A0A0A9C2M9_ARUDO
MISEQRENSVRSVICAFMKEPEACHSSGWSA